MKRLFTKISAAACVSLLIMNVSGCFKENHPGTYYTFTGETIADFLSNRESYFSSFIEVLKRAGLWGEMRTYGQYTCMAPTNEAIELFLEERNLSSISDLTVKECDTIARTHLIADAFYLADIVEGALPFPNMLDRYLIYTCDSTETAEGDNKVIYKINRSAIFLERDDTLQNGVMHIVDRVIQPSNSFLPDVMKEDSTIIIFYQALI
ncbi:MAG: fasciclin domain-containing protein, partial [Bacteroidaceae bacterium]|nr:fasciclin domain-containing protein [Bacteroidaceae bacterium]